MNTKPYRTILHGTCLTNGNHPQGSLLAQECPVLRRKRRRETPKQGGDTGSWAGATPDPMPGADLESGLRDGEDKPNAHLALAHLRSKGGRPKSEEQSRHSRYRRRHPEYRQREAERLQARRISGLRVEEVSIAEKKMIIHPGTYRT